MGQGLAGSCVAWTLHWAGRRVVLVDRGEHVTASKVAAGLITPVTGRRLVPTHRYDESYRHAVDFYRRIERELDCQLLEEKPAIRQFQNDDEQKIFEQKLNTGDGRFAPLKDAAGRIVGFEMRDAARLNVASFLERTRQYFTSLGQYQQADLDIDADVVIGHDGVSINRLGFRCSGVVFCQGYQDGKNCWYPTVPDGPVKGEILRVHLSNYHRDSVVHKGVWLVPDKLMDGKRSYLVGATYDRDTLKNTTTKEGREELLTSLKQIAEETPVVVDHVAAVRAGTKRRKPVVGQHPDRGRVFVLNGLGSHGSLLAPVASQVVRDLISGASIKDELREVLDILSGKPPTLKTSGDISRPRSLTQLAHNIIRRIVRPGDTVIDATAGNGNDTQLLANLVGPSGRTIAIDLQQSAIDATTARIERAGLTAEYLLADHACELGRLKSSGVSASAIMFNLGYLPGSDKLIVTRLLSTIAAIQLAREMLLPGGAVTIIAYRGHAGGLEEATAVEQLIAELPVDSYETSRIDGDSGNRASPVLFVVRRKIVEVQRLTTLATTNAVATMNTIATINIDNTDSSLRSDP